LSQTRGLPGGGNAKANWREKKREARKRSIMISALKKNAKRTLAKRAGFQVRSNWKGRPEKEKSLQRGHP